MKSLDLLCHVLLVCLITFLTMFYHVSAMNEQTILLAIGKELSISGWQINGSDFCSWPGIGCRFKKPIVEKLDLSGMRLQGNVTLISELRSLRWLDLSRNNFRGTIPTFFIDLSELEFLDLSFNMFEDSIPRELGRLRSLRALNLSHNLLSGSIPDELEGIVKLQDFRIFSNRLSGSIPMWLGNLTNLSVFAAYENQLGGEIPWNLGLNSELKMLNLHSNHLQGKIPESIFANRNLEFLVLTQNQLTGNVPKSIGKCRQISSIRIGNNKLSGNIPRTIGDISSLTYFEANDNDLSGEIIPEFSHCSNLTLLNLASNRFTGTIPGEFARLDNLQELILSGNNLFGEIPSSVLEAKSLNKLDLSNNKLNGTIPKNICNGSRLQYVLLDRNLMRGEIPKEIGKCVKLLEFRVGENHLTRQIPPEIAHLKSLQIALNLSHNDLYGELPRELGKLDKLVSLDVSNNQLSGNIPSTFSGMLSLIEVNFSNNRFTGAIPDFLPFQKSSNSSFLGNKGLCGSPLSIACSDHYHNRFHYHHLASYKNALAVIGSGLAVFVSVSVVVYLFMLRENQENAAKAEEIENGGGFSRTAMIIGDVFVENLKQAIDFDEAAKASMKAANLLSIGTFSSVYKAEMPSGMILSVRKLNSMDRVIIQHENRIIRELEKLSKLNHDNLITPLGFSIYQDSTLLLFHQHFPNGTLARFLHEPGHEPDWPARLGVAIGVAEGLAFLHSLAILHLDVSSSNVFLDSNLTPLLGEVEVSRLLDPTRGTASITAVAGSFGYIPPEYAYTMQVTPPGNVYSYGVVLLEILTTKLPVDESFGEGIDLVKMVHGAPARGETPEQILDSRLSTVSFSWRKEMLMALKIALLCTDSTPAKRPKMKNVVEMLKEIAQK